MFEKFIVHKAVWTQKSDAMSIKVGSNNYAVSKTSASFGTSLVDESKLHAKQKQENLVCNLSYSGVESNERVD